MYLYKGPEEIINEVIESNKENYNAWLGLMIVEDSLVKFQIDNSLNLLEIEEIELAGYLPEFYELEQVISTQIELDCDAILFNEKNFINLIKTEKDLLEGIN